MDKIEFNHNIDYNLKNENMELRSDNEKLNKQILELNIKKEEISKQQDKLKELNNKLNSINESNEILLNKLKNNNNEHEVNVTKLNEQINIKSQIIKDMEIKEKQFINDHQNCKNIMNKLETTNSALKELKEKHNQCINEDIEMEEIFTSDNRKISANNTRNRCTTL